MPPQCRARCPWLSLAGGVLTLVAALPAVAGEGLDDVRILLAQEEEKVKVLEQRLAARKNATARPSIPEAALHGIVADYLSENPGAAMPSGVQLGYGPDAGFFIRSAPRPTYVKWDDESRIPFDLRIRGTLEVDYSYYKVTDRLNHQTGQLLANPLSDFATLTFKRTQVTVSGTAFDPNLRYSIRVEGNNLGLPGIPDTHFTNAQFRRIDPGDEDISSVRVGSGVRIGNQTFIAYDFHPPPPDKDCGRDCPEGQVLYVPTLTLITGEIKPLVGLDSYLGTTTGALIERGIADSFFNVPRSMSAGIQFKSWEDRLFLQALLNNGYEGQTPNSDLDGVPSINVGLWYDFGGNWNEAQKTWNLFGTTLVDVDYSTCAVLRVGGGLAAIPLDSRALYGDAESGAIRVMPALPLGQRLIALLNGGPEGRTNNAQQLDPYALNRFNAYTFNTFVAGKYRGFNLSSEFWLRDLNNLVPQSAGAGNIVYLDAQGEPALYPAGHALLDYGMTTQIGYFVVPKKLFVGARWSWIRGQSGNFQGDGTVLSTVQLPGITDPVRLYQNAFRLYSAADEYTIIWAYYFKGHSLKWQNDIGWYTGGNPAGSRSSRGWVPGADGWLVRTRIQLQF